MLIHSVLSVEMDMGQEFILTSEDVLHIGRHMTPILGPEKTGKRWQLLWRLV